MYSKSPAAVKWFPVDTVTEAKSLYRSLALLFHPDRGGDTTVMAEINSQYDAILAHLDGQVSKGSDGKSRVYRYQPVRETAIRSLIDQLLSLRLPNVDLLLIGLYVWVLGATPKHAPQMCGLGLVWHDKRKCWYWKPADLPRSFYSGTDLGRIAETYGYEHFAIEPLAAVTA